MYNRGNTRCKSSFFARGVATVSANMGFSAFSHLVLLRLYKNGKNFKNMRTTVIDVNFDEESKSELRIGLPCKEKPENAGNCWKIMKLLVEINDVEKYLVHQ